MTGAYNIYGVDMTLLGFPSCPCYGDQPLIGAEANGFYINTNQFSLVTGHFVGTVIIAADKAALAAGAGSINGQGFLFTSNVFPVFYSLQPATTPPGGTFETAHSPYFSHTFVARAWRRLTARCFDQGRVEACLQHVVGDAAARNAVPAGASAAAVARV